jgi:glycine oxidase
MGRLLAFELATKGYAVDLYDAGSAEAPLSAANAAAAMLAPLAESAVTELSVVRMGHHSLARWPELIGRLGQPVYFQQAGTLVLWHRQDAAEAARFQQQLAATARLMPQLPAAEMLDARRVSQLEPALRDRFAQGLYLPEEGQLDNRELLSALLEGLRDSRVDLHWNSPRSPADFGADFSGWLFDCRGLGARADCNGLRGVRGEVIRVHAPDVGLSRPTRLLHPRYPLYIAPKPNGVFVIGATEIESDDLSAVSVRSMLELLSAAYTVHPAFGEARVLETAAQCRPTLRDNLPALRWLGPKRLQINGLYRHGFLISPALLDVVMECVANGGSELAEQFALQVNRDAQA